MDRTEFYPRARVVLTDALRTQQREPFLVLAAPTLRDIGGDL